MLNTMRERKYKNIIADIADIANADDIANTCDDTDTNATADK